jgi:hypothetical protein
VNYGGPFHHAAFLGLTCDLVLLSPNGRPTQDAIHIVNTPCLVLVDGNIWAIVIWLHDPSQTLFPSNSTGLYPSKCGVYATHRVRNWFDRSSAALLKVTIGTPWNTIPIIFSLGVVGIPSGAITCGT